MIRINNFIGQNPNISVVEQEGIFTIIEHDRDYDVSPSTIERRYHMEKMNYCLRQIVVQLEDNAIRLVPVRMQFMTGNIQISYNSVNEPIYKGTGLIVTEPTHCYPIIENVAFWKGMVCENGMLICCDEKVQSTILAGTKPSNTIADGARIFECMSGDGYAVLNSPCPREELYEVILENDCIKIAGNNAVCWSKSLEFTVERSDRSVIGSVPFDEGLVNVRGTGRILMAPLR